MLLTQRKFLPFFIAQSLGAFNDNLYKNAIVILLTYHAAQFSGNFTIAEITNLAAGLFILPFWLFSGIGGFLADHRDKANLIRHLKAFEVVIVGVACAGLTMGHTPLLLLCVFLLGFQSALFGPVKYAYLPAILPESQLMAGNAWVETATFVVILLGTLSAGLIVQLENPVLVLNSALVAIAVVGYLVTLKLPPCPPILRKPFEWSVMWTSVGDSFSNARQVRSVWLSILGISWFWFLGAMVLAQLPGLAKETLKLDESGLTQLLALFSVGVGAGSLLSERLSGKKVEIGLVPLGSIGMTVCLVMAYLEVLNPVPGEHLKFGLWLSACGLFGGFFIVPLYALIQSRSQPGQVASVVGANNILNAMFMVLAAAFGLAFAQLEIPALHLLAVAAVLNSVVAVYIYSLVPEFLWRFVVWMLVHSVYRFRVKGSENIPDEGPAIVVCNHVGFSDAVILAAAIRRPLRFIMYYKIFKSPALGWFFRTAKAIPIASRQEDESIFNEAFERVSQALKEGEIVCVFPEGKLTADGQVDVFKPGLLKILEKDPVPVIPMALGGLWGSMFTRRNDGLKRLTMREWNWGRPIDLVIGSAIEAKDVEMETLRQRVIELRTRP